MKLRRCLTSALVVCSVAMPLISPALQATESTSHTTSRVDPQALGQLKRMSNALSAAKEFTYKSTSTVEVPAKSGQLLTLFPTADVALIRPDKLSVKITGEAPPFEFLYDGTTAAAYAPGTNVYSVAKTPPTIDAMLPSLREETGIRFASAALFFTDPYKVLTRGVSSALVVGQTSVNGVLCEHLAFRSPGVNWEIWIEAGTSALPLRLAVTYTDREYFPRTLVEFSDWNLQPWLSASSFVFHTPVGAHEIPFASVFKSRSR